MRLVTRDTLVNARVSTSRPTVAYVTRSTCRAIRARRCDTTRLQRPNHYVVRC